MAAPFSSSSSAAVASLAANPWATPNLRTITAPAANWRPQQGGAAAAAPVRAMHAHRTQTNGQATQPQPQQSAHSSQHHNGTMPTTPAGIAAAPAVASSSLSSLPQRSTARAQLLQAATSLGFHGWNASLAHPLPAADPLASLAACPARLDASGGAGGLVDLEQWLQHSARVLELMQAHSAKQREADQLQAAVEAHEREEDTSVLTSMACLHSHAERAWALSQHLSALMSGQAEPSVEQRAPQPSHFPLIARDQDARNQGAASQFTLPPAQVHPRLRQLLQQPYGSAKDKHFIQVEPELQSVVCNEIERMCTDVAQWRGGASATVGGELSVSSSSADAVTAAANDTPLQSLEWTSNLAAQQKPISDTLALVLNSWSRVQRAGDSLSSLHAATKRLHELEQQCDSLAQQQRDEIAQRVNRMASRY